MDISAVIEYIVVIGVCLLCTGLFLHAIYLYKEHKSKQKNNKINKK